MVSLGIKNTQNVFTNLGFILSDQSDVTVKIAEYDNDRNFKLKKQFTGSLIDLFHNVKEQADRFNDVSAKIDFRSFKRNCFLSGSIIKRNDFKCFCARRLFHQIKY